MRPALVFRLKASGLHLLGSAVVIGLFLWLIYGYWYAHPFQVIYSTLDVVKVLIGVDLVLGPLLTLIVFNIAKPRSELARDLAIILAFQISALAWGVHVTHSVRPQFAVYLDNEVYVVTAKDIDMQALPANIKAPSIFELPVTVYVQALQSVEEIQRHVMDMVSKGAPDIMYQPERYQLYNVNRERAVKELVAKSSAISTPTAATENWMDSVLARYGGVLTDYAFCKVTAGQYSSTVALRLADGRLMDVMPAPLPENKS